MKTGETQGFINFILKVYAGSQSGHVDTVGGVSRIGLEINREKCIFYQREKKIECYGTIKYFRCLYCSIYQLKLFQKLGKLRVFYRNTYKKKKE